MKNILLGVFTTLLFSSFAQHTLPKLEYSYKALEPFIDAQTMEIHHSKHHQGYVNKLNKALVGSGAEKTSLIDLNIHASQYNSSILNNAGGHYNHSLFWEILTDKKETRPTDEFSKVLESSFKSMDDLKAQLNKAASTRFGSGWAWLIVTPDKKLKVTSTANQDNPLMDITAERGIPIIAIDVWEHAYYLKYQNKRGDYLSSIWSLLNWESISKKYNAAINSPVLATLNKSNKIIVKELKDALQPLQTNHYNSEIEHHSAYEVFFKKIGQLDECALNASIKSDKLNAIIEDLKNKTCAIKETYKDHALEEKTIENLKSIETLIQQIDTIIK